MIKTQQNTLFRVTKPKTRITYKTEYLKNTTISTSISKTFSFCEGINNSQGSTNEKLPLLKYYNDITPVED